MRMCAEIWLNFLKEKKRIKYIKWKVILLVCEYDIIENKLEYYIQSSVIPTKLKKEKIIIGISLIYLANIL